jgi:hypothetical protein
MLKQLTISICLLLSVNSLKAQNLVEDMKTISSVLDTAKSVQIQAICKVYSQKGGELMSIIHTGLSKRGKLSVSTLEEMDIFTNEKYGVYINNEDKSITVISKSKYADKLKSVNNKNIDQFVSWMKKQETKTSFNPKLLSETNGIRTYSIANMEDLKEVVISIDLKKHTIEKISYEFSESSQQNQRFIVLDYSKFLINSGETTLNQTDYYIQKSGKFLPGNKYKSYSITTDL